MKEYIVTHHVDGEDPIETTMKISKEVLVDFAIESRSFLIGVSIEGKELLIGKDSIYLIEEI
ncbi:hypothetical protein [Carnobacterium maltaromaticum]|uniref:hypothetical protein n=1 Tax=Carnobacterium maltaromaticum TaxID=2751 RepID=UPI0039AF0B5D